MTEEMGQILAALERLETGQKELKTRLFGNEGPEAGVVGKFETRITKLENWQARAAGIIAAVGSFFALTVAAVESWIHVKNR